MFMHSARGRRTALLPAIAFSIASCVSLSALAQTNPPTLEERMSEAQFKSFGLDKLSAEELRGLNEWLQQRGPATAAAGSAVPAVAADQDPRLGFRGKASDRVTVNARIVGEFTGWSGNTIFKLDNGQEWQQAEVGSFSGQRIENAEVTIKPKMMGNWLLVVEYCQCRIGVRRIK